MATKRLDHPAFGACELVPTLVAVKWKTPLGPKGATSVLSAYSLKFATQTPKVSPATRGARDPRPVNVNHSESLSWASGTKLTDSALNKVRTDANVEWVGPVYRATAADPGPQSYFAINPTILLLSQEAAAAVGDVTSLDPSASIDQNRTKLIKAFVVVKFPNGNAIEVADQIRKNPATKAVADGVRFENTPYLSPTCNSGCGCSGTAIQAPAPALGKCAPSTTPVIPNDTFFPSQWGLQRINAPAAWPLTEGDPNVVIAVLDQGVELLHPDLNMWPISYSTITHTNDGSPVGNHGTACAGIIGAKIDNALGVTGLAGNCRVMAIATNFADTEIVEGLNYAADNGARVISMSFGVYSSWMVWDFTIIETALQYCQEKNLILVAASGNEDQPVARFPGSDPRTICIGGSNRDDVRKSIGDTSIENWWGACYGPDLDVVAPCLEIYTTDRLGGAGYTPTDYDPRFNGTSSATPHVAALAGLIISLNPALSNTDVRKIISETCDKVGVGTYTYLATAGKAFGTWNNEVGYGRINAERALLVACESGRMGEDSGPCAVKLPRPEPCCVSPCDPPWRPDANCMFWYEVKFFRVPLGRKEGQNRTFAGALATGPYIEFRITYLHKWCLLGKQHGPLLYTVTLLPGEKVTLYHSERYRTITSAEQRYSVQTTFMQFLSVVHEARVTNTLQTLSDRLASVKTVSSVSVGGGLGSLLGLPSGSASSQTNVTDHNMLQVGFVSDQFNQSLVQSSQLTHAERSLVVSTYQEKDSVDISSRTLFNANECRAVTYFVRKVVELYAFSTTVSDISYRIVAPNIPPDWHTIDDLGWLPQVIQNEIKTALKLLPKVGDVIEKPQPISLPTDGAVYDPELANCCACEPQREAAIKIRLEKQKAEALKACLDAQELEIELQRRRMLLQKGDLSAFEATPASPESSAAPTPSG
jgi:subtilisin family serine protease